VRVPGSVPGRVVSIEKDACQVSTECGELFAGLSGKMRLQAESPEKFPAVGDWVVIQPLAGEARGIIHAILPRKSRFSRQASGGRGRISGGRTEEQVVAANVDTVFLVSGLDGGRNLNLRRMERYIAIARSSGATPVIVLNKADLCPDIQARICEAETVASGIPVCCVSAVANTGLNALEKYLTPGTTSAFLGQSGVGKSAIINALLGAERQITGAVRERDRRGRHTTTRRELILLPGGGTVIDTPGMREIQIWGDKNSLDNTFEDIARIADGCRFSDCRHDREPGCAVRAAIERGELDADRFAHFQKLQGELQHQAARRQGLAALEEKTRWKQISQLRKRFKKNRDV
jgi:ribosome biogenesis GTPase / thiamine phosphate phosphatase